MKHHLCMFCCPPRWLYPTRPVLGIGEECIITTIVCKYYINIQPNIIQEQYKQQNYTNSLAIFYTILDVYLTRFTDERKRINIDEPFFPIGFIYKGPTISIQPFYNMLTIYYAIL